MLTRKQHELLVFIDRYLKTSGFSPSFEEMKAALDLKSKSGIHRLISALEERGFLARMHNHARALEVLRLPGDDLPGEAPAPNVIQRDFSSNGTSAADSVQLPLYGRIAAGLPIEAMQDHAAHIAVPLALLGSGEHYALEVSGDSMIDAGIQDGDTVVIRKGDTAENGQIVVAVVDDNEVTLKRMRRRANAIELEPANTRYQAQIFPAERVRVQGRLVALLRRY